MTALVGAAAAVVLIVGGIGLAATSRTSAPSVVTPPDWRHDHPITIPAGSKLIPYDAPPLISPSTVTAGGPPAGYLTTSIGEKFPRPQHVVTEQDTINGHRAEFNRTPNGTKQWGVVGGGVRMWFTWQLSDGSYRHVWNVAEDKAALLVLARGIVEKPSPLRSRISLDVTLPGLTARYTDGIRNLDQRASGALDEEIYLCPAGAASIQAIRLTTDQVCLSAHVRASTP